MTSNTGSGTDNLLKLCPINNHRNYSKETMTIMRVREVSFPALNQQAWPH